MRASSRVILCAPAFLFVLACGQKNEAHPSVFQCDDNCVEPPPKTGGGGSSGDAALGGAGGGGGAAGAPASDAGVTVHGVVEELVSGSFTTSTSFTQTATVRFDGPTGVPVEGTYDGQSFSIPGAAIGKYVWATVIPNAPAILTTVQPTDTTSGNPITLGVVPADTIDTVYDFLTVPETRASGACAVVLHFVSAAGAPVSNVVVKHKTEKVAYDTNGSWSDVASGTGSAGYAVVVNVAVGSTASKQTFTYTSPSVPAPGIGVDLLVEPDGVTLASVLVQ